MHRLKILIILSVLIISANILATQKRDPKISNISENEFKELRIRPNLSTADTCSARTDQGIALQITGWVYGEELYKNYLDPSISCPNPYPYTITEINMPMSFTKATTITVSVDVESADLSNPACPFPGDVLAMSSTYDLNIPGEGAYNLWIPLDTPILVNGPFFAGFYVGAVDTTAGIAVLTDENPSALCTSYNIWDETLGFVDLLNNDIWNFPGQLVLYATGFSGGGSGQVEPEPQVNFLTPNSIDTLYSSTVLWAIETSGSNIIDYLLFEYSTGGIFVEIGRDYDGESTFRDDNSSTRPDDGYRFNWDFSNLSEDQYLLRVTAIDTLGRSSSETIGVTLEPTPPTASITSPFDISLFCSDLTLSIQNNDEDLNEILFYKKEADADYSAGVTPSVTHNYISYYSGPIAAAYTIKLWSDRGYTNLFDITIDSLINQFGTLCKTDAYSGTFDDDFYQGLELYNNTKGNLLQFDFQTYPDYVDLRIALEEEEKSVIVALGGTKGIYLILDGFDSWQQLDGTYLVKYLNPITGLIGTTSYRSSAGKHQLEFMGEWLRIEMMITAMPNDWMVYRSLIGSDNNQNDGWSFSWTPTGLIQKEFYYIRAVGTDASNMSGSSAILIQFDCSGVYQNGDYNNDQQANLADLTFLIDYYINNGPSPIGGDWRSDANCDNHLNITDIIYYMNFLFGSAAEPCN